MLTAEFWVLVSFLIFLGIVWKTGGFKIMLGGLDARRDRISAELAEARRLREEAAAVLAGYKKRQAEAEREAEGLVAAAREEAERVARETEERMAEFVRRRTAAAEARIAQAEAQATAEVRAAAIDAALKASEQILREQASGAAGADLLARSLGDVKAKLNA
jgi:F-type H+-transporting ATPase subunit b